MYECRQASVQIAYLLEAVIARDHSLPKHCFQFLRLSEEVQGQYEQTAPARASRRKPSAEDGKGQKEYECVFVIIG